MTNKQERADVYRRVTQQIIQAMEQAQGKWEMPWHRSPTLPTNALTGKPYRGVNVLSLWATAAALNYNSGTWATYAQWRELGAHVRKGEKSSLVVFWKFREDNASETENGEEEEQPTRRGPIARGYNVFHASQVDGYASPESPALPPFERMESAERFFTTLSADLRHGGGRAFYNHRDDFIQLPPFAAFRESAAYYATLAHEFIHWSGAPHRLNRDLKGRFGEESYAAEELVAELGAAFLCADLGVSNVPRHDHAAYLENWIRVLRQDTRAIFTAASQAQSAADWLHSRLSLEEPAIPASGYAA